MDLLWKKHYVAIWPDQYSQISEPVRDKRRKFFKDLLTQDPSQAEDIEMATIWLKAIDVICDKAVEKILTKEDGAAIELLQKIKSNIDSNAYRAVKRSLWYFFALFVFVSFILIGLTVHFGWETMEPWIWVVELAIIIGGYLYFSITLNETEARRYFFTNLYLGNKERCMKDWDLIRKNSSNFANVIIIQNEIV